MRPFSLMFAELRREWGAINQSEMRTINCLMFYRCTGCVWADRGHTPYYTFCDIQKLPLSCSLTIYKQCIESTCAKFIGYTARLTY